MKTVELSYDANSDTDPAREYGCHTESVLVWIQVQKTSVGTSRMIG